MKNLAWLGGYDVPIIANVAGSQIADYVKVASGNKQGRECKST